MSKLEEILTTLEAELGDMDADIDHREYELRKIKENRRQIAKAMRSLGADSAPPCPTGKQVTPLVERLIRDNDGLNAEELYDLARDELNDVGVGASGLKLRVLEAVEKIDGVEQSDDGLYRLSDDLTATVAG